MIEYIFKIIWFFLPIGFANMAPVFVKKINILNIPIDFNKKINKEPIFGANKTIRGLFAAIILGAFIFLLQKYLFNFDFFTNISLINYQYIPWFAGLFIGLGVIIGDVIKSFFKRRLKIKPGQSWIPFDQVDYVLGGILFFSWFYIPTLIDIVTLLFTGVILHIIVNVIGFYLGIREQKI